jgi:hypothetical protein
MTTMSNSFSTKPGSTAFPADFGMGRKVHFQSNQAEEELPPKDMPRFFGFRTSAVIEIAVFFVIALIIDFFWQGNRFADVNPHPFFIIVVMIATQYGSSEGLLAATIATLALLVGNLPAKTLDMTDYDFLLAMTKLPILWFVSALLLGELRLRQIRERDTLREFYEKAKEREEFISQSFRQLEKVKNNLEVQMASQMKSGLSLYSAANKLEKLEPRDVVMAVGEFVQAIMNAEKFSLYLLNNNKLEVVISQNWEDDDLYQPVINNSNPLFEAVVSRREFLTVINDEQRDILGHEGLIAGPVLNKDTGEVIGMLKVEKCHFLDINLTTVETFRMLCEWIGATYTNARRYQDAKKESLINPSLQLLSQSFLRRQSDFLSALGKRAGFDVSMLLVRLENPDELDREAQQAAAVALSEAVRSNLRAVDQAFEYNDNHWNFAVLLPYTPAQNAHMVVDKIQKALGKKTSGRKGTKARFAHEVRSLYRHAPRAA